MKGNDTCPCSVPTNESDVLGFTRYNRLKVAANSPGSAASAQSAQSGKHCAPPGSPVARAPSSYEPGTPAAMGSEPVAPARSRHPKSQPPAVPPRKIAGTNDPSLPSPHPPPMETPPKHEPGTPFRSPAPNPASFLARRQHAKALRKQCAEPRRSCDEPARPQLLEESRRAALPRWPQSESVQVRSFPIPFQPRAMPPIQRSQAK
jgi:hypothetical protein